MKKILSHTICQRTMSITVIACALAACGGGGDTAAAPVPVVSTPAPTPVPAAGKWQLAVNDTWQWQLRGAINTSYDAAVYDVDLVDAAQATIDQLHRQGRHVVCYFSAGSSEDFRSDAGVFKPTDMGSKLAGWAGERWLDIRSANVRQFMAQRRLDLAVSKGCDGVEPDNVDGYANSTGFPLTASDQLDYNRFLATEAHRRNLKVGLKNDLAQVALLVNEFDFAVNEQCHEFGECDKLHPFTAAAKPVFNAEYRADYRTNAADARTMLCAEAKAENFRTLVLPLELDDTFRYSCG
ncbi:endo alpha-1,4 polygalactosaminidase [Janthinobacterium sp. P210006]|uniref:endo alpha-1,4 polygalactosaminidase n=1 Tax=Janthinobacterium sp. P210006 TaxID=3112939 RepID=UPI002E2690BE|nr:endo alpha-1,4 polygalactosaminidase [Janthinobacterium sp. P210006]